MIFAKCCHATSVLLLLAVTLSVNAQIHTQSPAHASSSPEIVILDTDIGDDIDDAFALGLLLASPEFKIAGVTTAWRDTTLRASLTQRFLCATGREDIPVFAGVATTEPNPNFTQKLWATNFAGPQKSWPDAVSFVLDTIRKHPGQVTLISIAPLSNVGAMIDKDPETFHKLKRVIIMGGSIRAGYNDLGYTPARGIDPEYNIRMDVASAQKLFRSGVPLYVMPLDSTQLKFDEVKRNVLFSQDTPLINSIMELYQQWTAGTRSPTPTLFDVVAIAQAIDPTLCPTQPMHIDVDKDGYTREIPGPPNAHVCMKSDSDRFFTMYFNRLLSSQAKAMHASRACRNATAAGNTNESLVR